MRRALKRMRTWVMAAAAAGFLQACTQDPDVVGYLLPLEAGPALDASTDANPDMAADAHCEPTNRFMRARLPEQLVLDLYMMDCKIPLQDFMSKPGQTSISAVEFSSLLRATELMPEPGTPAALLCDPERGGYYLEPWQMPQRLVLCPVTCERVKDEVERVLSLDGCDPEFDDGGAQ